MTRDEVLGGLDQHGVTLAHLRSLLVLLETNRNGSATLHVVHGQLSQLDVRLMLPNRTHALHQLETFLEEVSEHGNRVS
jgi:hypothetical protein